MAQVIFHKLVVESQEYASDDDHMVSQIFFTLIDNRHKPHDGLFATLKQAVGSDIDSGPIEVSAPQGYAGPFNYEPFREHAERYYRGCFGKAAWGLRVGPKAKKVRLSGCTFEQEVRAEI